MLALRFLGSPVVPFYPFLGGSLLKPNSRKKGTLIIKGLLGNLVSFNTLIPEPESLNPKGSCNSTLNRILGYSWRTQPDVTS